MNAFDLTDKVAIITGASRGIGAAMAAALVHHGAKVVVSSRSDEAVQAVAQHLGERALGVACHVGKAPDLINLVEQTVTHYGGVDILINNAATNPVFGPLSETTAAAFDKVMEINVKACMLLSNLCYPKMKERGGGSIINIASVEGVKPSPGLGVYSVSKAALIMLTKSQAKEWGADNIRCNAICPGLIKTKFSAALWQNEKILSQFEKSIPLGRMGASDEIAGLAVYLASSASSYTTGAVYGADGGYLLG
ncbi:MAG: SDR family oxidoreductase [Saprospiraceae bacterium]|nr:SDR family oxidoreductase [Saprospiraceae bacterium]